MPREKMLTAERDIPVLQFIWKWKVATTAAIYQKFFMGTTQKRAYGRLLDLSEMGVLRRKCDDSGSTSVWTLTEKGFKAIRNSLPVLQEEGFRSENMEHDLLVAAFHLGNWLTGVPDGCDLFTEQELRRFHPDMYPEWVPRTPLHRPDGFWRVKSSSKSLVIAVEVELSQKRSADYGHTGRSYAYYHAIDRVLWLVQKRTLAETVLAKISDAAPNSASRHSFVIESDFRKHIWETPILLGQDTGQTLSNILGVKPWYSPSNYQVHPLLDTRRSYRFSDTYLFNDPRQNPDCVPYSLITGTPSCKTYKRTERRINV